MIGKLIQVDSFTISSPVASVTIGGGTSGSSSINFEINTNDVYKVILNDIQGASDSESLKVRVTKTDGSGGATAQSTSNYDYAKKTFRTDNTYSNNTNTDQSEVFVNTQLAMGTGTEETLQGIQYLYSFNNSSENSFVTDELIFRNYNSGVLMGGQGGWVYTVAEAHNGLNYFMSSGNLTSGTFTLYKVA